MVLVRLLIQKICRLRYGKTKADGEAAVRQNLNEHYIIRTAWLYGWAGKNFVYTMIKAMNTHDAVKVEDLIEYRNIIDSTYAAM